MSRIDLNKARAVRAAQAETDDDGPVVVLDGLELVLPRAIPAAALEAFEGGSLTGFLAGVMGDSQWAAFKKAGGDHKDIEVLVSGYLEELGIDPGESLASGVSSDSTSER
ncbi:MAG: hypothetical protein P1T08_12765 [Acidimicrobiia bacterium]|nr:hypothetical protein [Acidimicrobiia bacterium]